MPHIIVEHSSNIALDTPDFLAALHKTVASHESVNIGAIKTRAIPLDYTIAGDENDADTLMHITLKLLPGRDDATRKAMAQALYDTAQSFIRPTVSLSVEVMELDAASYTK
ncbi:MAG: 5-carboxymethyl-2-hydroxymuconate Delta-isomerase [Alphaproteobacteria bacterium]